MTNRKQPIQWPTENKQYKAQQKTNNTVTNRKQTIQWLTENKQYNGQQKATKKKQYSTEN
jgi:hypothetical protein